MIWTELNIVDPSVKTYIKLNLAASVCFKFPNIKVPSMGPKESSGKSSDFMEPEKNPLMNAFKAVGKVAEDPGVLLCVQKCFWLEE